MKRYKVGIRRKNKVKEYYFSYEGLARACLKQATKDPKVEKGSVFDTKEKRALVVYRRTD